MIPEPPTCPLCKGPTYHFYCDRRVRRGERIATYECFFWECPDCQDFEGREEPFRFSDGPLGRYSQKLAEAAWELKFGEPFPTRPPRPPRVRAAQPPTDDTSR